MKTQTLYKRLSLPLLVTVISATGIGVTPARSASLIGLQSTAINTNPEAILIAGRLPRCEYGQMPPGCDLGHTQGRPVLEPSASEKLEIEKLEIEKLEIENRIRQEQRELQQQQRELQQHQPTAKPSPQN